MISPFSPTLGFGPLGIPELIILAVLVGVPVAIIVIVVKLANRKK